MNSSCGDVNNGKPCEFKGAKCPRAEIVPDECPACAPVLAMKEMVPELEFRRTEHGMLCGDYRRARAELKKEKAKSAKLKKALDKLSGANGMCPIPPPCRHMGRPIGDEGVCRECKLKWAMEAES
jgi:hypothetical protein